MIGSTLALAAALVLAPTTPAAADNGEDGTGGFLSPSFDRSPVNLVVCAVPDACRIEAPRGPKG